MGRAKLWYEKCGYQHYNWVDLRAALINTFSRGTDVVDSLRKLVNIESDAFLTYNDFVMEKVSQINRLPFDVPEEIIVRIVIGCITAISLRNSLMFVMPSTVQNLIDHLSAVRERPQKKVENHSHRNDTRDIVQTRVSKRGADETQAFLKRLKNNPEKRCFGCGNLGHIRANCTKSNTPVNTTPQPSSTKICTFCKKSGHEERDCWQRREQNVKMLMFVKTTWCLKMLRL